MSGRRSRDKGARTERAIAKVLQANGFAAAKISRVYQPRRSEEALAEVGDGVFGGGLRP